MTKEKSYAANDKEIINISIEDLNNKEKNI